MKNFGKLSDQQIYNKEFNIEFKGYSMLEVDAFLDDVILDYQNFQLQLEKAADVIQQLQRSNASLQAKLIEVEGRLEASKHSEPSTSNQTDLLKRLAKLEQEVYQK